LDFHYLAFPLPISGEQLSKLAEVVTLVAYIWETTSLNLGWYVSCSASSFSGIPQSVQRAAGRLSEIRARPPYPKSLPFCYSLIAHSTVQHGLLPPFSRP